MEFIVWLIPIILAITVHEYAHGWMAFKLNDYTAKSMGRLTLNPIPHIDPIGTIAVPAILFFTSGFLFGWAKPVPINYNNLSDKKNGVLKVSLAGPASNIIMAFIWGIIAYLGLFVLDSEIIISMGAIGVFFNLLLAIFNLLPIPPLDGSVILRQFLPYKYKHTYDQYEHLGLFLVIALMLFGFFSLVVLPIINLIISFFPGMSDMVIFALYK